MMPIGDIAHAISMLVLPDRRAQEDARPCIIRGIALLEVLDA